MAEGSGDQESLPVSVRSFVAARIDEVIAISKELQLQSGRANGKENNGSGLVFQHVPKHMRRRAVSHNVKRLPIRLHQGHLNQLNKGRQSKPIVKPRRPNRKHRRRKKDLLSEYNRRQRSIKWMETHVWHGKRFHMQKKWGWQIPIEPTDKSYRAIYRASTRYSTMQDTSFIACLQLVGPFDFIAEKMKAVVPGCAHQLSVDAKYFTDFSREGALHIYENGKYPFGYIGRITFVWKLDKTMLWFWVHSSIKAQLLVEFVHLFELEEFLIEASPVGEVPDAKASVDARKLEPKRLDRAPTWRNRTNSIELVDLEGALNRFSLNGPQSTKILQDALKLHASNPNSITEAQTNKSNVEPIWYEKHYDKESQVWEAQRSIWQETNGFVNYPSNLVLPLTVRDPRIFLPKKRVKLHPKNHTSEVPDQFLSKIERYCQEFQSPLWDMNMRKLVTNGKMSDNEFGKERSKLLIPGSQVQLGRNENQVPVILIHKPDQMQGWDIILPASYAMSFWVALSYRCVRACGHRDAIHFTFSRMTEVESIDVDAPMSSLVLPNLFPPDSLAGQEEAEYQYNYLKETYFRLPTDKRQEFHRLRCPFPFYIDWTKLLQFSLQKQDMELLLHDRLFILRDEKILKLLRNAMSFKSFKNGNSWQQLTLPEIVIPIQNCLIPVYVISRGRGKPQVNTVLCIPSQDDLCNVYSRTDSEDYSEPPPSREVLSAIESKKSSLRQKHKKLLALLRKKRKKERSKLCEGENPTNEFSTNEYESAEISEQYNKEMNQLFIPEDPISVLSAMSRTPIGFITFGGENYKIGKCTGAGYITWLGFIQLLQFYESYYNYLVLGEMKHKKSSRPIRKRMKNLILFRDSKSSLIYRIAQFYIS